MRLNELMVKDPRLAGMPETPVRVGVPTTLARDLIQRVIAGVVDQVTLDLKNIRVGKRGTVKKIITIGEYDLKVTVNHVTGRLKTGRPTVTFGEDRVALAIPVTVASGTGRATINFKWDGKNISGAVCGDMDVTQVVSGSVRPATYPVAGGLVFTATARQIIAAPRLPTTRINLKVAPSGESWAAAQKILDDKGGVCGFVLDHVDIMGLIKEAPRQGLQHPPAHREGQGRGDASWHRADHGRARPAGGVGHQGRQPRDHRADDLARRPRVRGHRPDAADRFTMPSSRHPGAAC